MRGPIQAPILLHFGKSIRAGWALRCLAPSSQATPATPRLTSSRRALPVLPCQARTTEPCLPCVTKPIGAHRSTPRLPRIAKRCLSGHACHAVPRSRLASPHRACNAVPELTTPWLTMPAASGHASPVLALPALPCHARARPRLTSQARSGRDLRIHACQTLPQRADLANPCLPSLQNLATWRLT